MSLARGRSVWCRWQMCGTRDWFWRRIAAQLGVPTLPGQPLTVALIRWLDRFPILLVVDNFEHVLAGAERLTELLDACEHLKLLVTSQARLRLRPERVLRVGPLPVPEAGRVDLADLVDQPAVALYCDRALGRSPPILSERR